MKRIFRSILACLLAMVLTVGSTPLTGLVELELPDWLNFSKLFEVEAEAVGYSGSCGENLTWTLDESTGELVISGTGSMNNWSYYSNVPWSDSSSYIKSVTICNSVTSIGDYAFSDCDSLTSITIPGSVTIIGDNAFEDCTNLTSITIPDSVTRIGSYAFAGCTSLTSITIPNSVTNIEKSAFNSCTGLVSITLSDSITSIGNSAFNCCISLTNLILPESITSIGACAFENCTGLKSITIPAGVTNIGDYAFWGCDRLECITVGNSVTSIADYTFLMCTNLTSITIPDSVTSIGNGAFYGCDSLTNIYYSGTQAEWDKIDGGSSYKSYVIFGEDDSASTSEGKISFSEDIYTCYVGESVCISGDVSSSEGVGNINLSWSSGDGVELMIPASIINSDEDNASFSLEVKGLSEGMHTVTVYTSSGKSASCTIEVMKTPESELSVVVEPLGGSYYLIDGGLYDQNLNDVSSLQYKVTVGNFYIAPTGTTFDEETKEKLKIENVSAAASLSDYSNLLIDIEALDELRNIGDIEVNESKTVIVDVTLIGTEMPADGVTLDVTATADGKAAVSESAAISVKDKLYNPYAKINVTVTPQSIDYSNKEYSADEVGFTVTVTNAIPSSFSGKSAKLKQWSDYDLTVSEIKITPEDSKLLKSAGIKTEKVNKVLHAGESYTFTGTYNVNIRHKMDKEIKSETVGFVFDASTSANSPSADKSVTFINGDYDKKIEYKKKSLRELLKEMMGEVRKCDVLTSMEKSIVETILSAHLGYSDLTAITDAMDMANTVYELACYVDDVHDIGYKEAGDIIIEAISNYADEKYKEAVDTCLEELRDNESFEKFIQWYADGQKTADSKSKKGEVRCPVDVYVYDKNGNEVMAIIDNKVVKAADGIHAFVCEDDKIFYLSTDADYEIKIIATGNGTMDYIITEYSDENELRKTVYEDIPLVVDETYSGAITKHTLPDEGSYNLTLSDGTEIAHDKIEFVDSNITVQADIRTPSTTTIKYGDRIVLHADLSEALPAGWSIKWSASNNNFDYTVSADGSTCAITPSKSGDTTFTATVYDENGNVVSEDTQVMKSKAGFFDKFVAFFKKLFGMTKIIQQSINF